MRNFILYCFIGLFTTVITAQEIYGSWQTTATNEDGTLLTSVLIFTDSYNVITTYESDSGKFLSTKGGSWIIDGNQLVQTFEFHSQKPELVGTQETVEIKIENDFLQFLDEKIKFKKVDDGNPGKLYGAWLMSARVKNDQMQSRDTSLPRKTMKILSGTRFQWISYHTETKKFMATGGGTYTTIDGKYTETIEFFSKRISKIGMRLTFDFDLQNGNWNHKGFSTKGDPIHEIWSLRN